MFVITAGRGCRIGDVVPGIGQGGLTDGEGDITVVNRINGQCQRGGAVATGLVEVVTDQSVVAGNVKEGVKAVGLVSCSGANIVAQCGSVAVVDGQMQRDGAVAAFAGEEMLLIVTAGNVCFIIPSVAVAGSFAEFRFHRIVDSQV